MSTLIKCRSLKMKLMNVCYNVDFRDQYHFRDLCTLLNTSPPTLCSLTLELFAREVINREIKIDVLTQGGAAGADILLTHVLKVEQNTEHLNVVQKAIEKEQFIHDITETMKRESVTVNE